MLPSYEATRNIDDVPTIAVATAFTGATTAFRGPNEVRGAGTRLPTRLGFNVSEVFSEIDVSDPSADSQHFK